MTPDETEAPRAQGLDPRMRASILGVAAIGATFAAGAFAGFGARAGVSVATGAVIAVANLYFLARIVGALLGGRVDGNPNAGLWGIFGVLKIVILFGGVWLLFSSNLVDPISLVVGWGALPVGITLGTLFSDKADRDGSPRGRQAPPAGPVA
jgi:hypothetical protein